MNEIKVIHTYQYGHDRYTGFVDSHLVISISNNVNGLYWTVGSSSCLPSDFVKAKAYSDCMAQTFKAVSEHDLFKKDDRVSVKSGCFSSGSKGTIVFIEPSEKGRIWVHRDGSSQPCFYYRNELEKI